MKKQWIVGTALLVLMSGYSWANGEPRKTQEELKCVNCGRDYPADLKAARVLATYLCSAVLRNSLLTQDNTGAYVPKKRMNKENTKQILEKYSRDIVETFRANFPDK